MKEEEFKKRLSEVSEWRIPETVTGTKDGDARKSRRPGRPSAEDLEQEALEREFFEKNGGVNPTFPPQVLKLKTQSCVCEDCGKFCEHGRHKEKRIYESNGKRHWRERCTTCEKCLDPYTKKFTLTGTQASIKWHSYLKDVTKRYTKPATFDLDQKDDA